MTSKSFFVALIVTLGSFVGFATPAQAYKLTPMSQVFAPSGSRATRSFEVVNDGKERVALELSITTLERDLDYGEINRNADEHFLVYPAQILLPPGGRQTIRVTWVGDPDPKRELTYRLVVEQLPIENGVKGSAEASGSLRVLTTFRASLYIRPAKAAPRVSLESAGLVESKEPGNAGYLALTVKNTGTAQGVLKNCATTVSSGETTVALPPESLRLLQQGRILAGTRRRFLIPWPSGLPRGSVSVNLSCSVGL